MRGRRLILAVAVAGVAAALAVAGCGARDQRPLAPAGAPAAAPEPATAPDVTGLWTIAAVKGQPASLSQLALEPGGGFRHTGNNALGMPVNFAGRYELGESPQGPVIRLTYDDFPTRPTVWYFKLDGDTLAVSPVAGGEDAEGATVFRREKQQ